MNNKPQYTRVGDCAIMSLKLAMLKIQNSIALSASQKYFEDWDFDVLRAALPYYNDTAIRSFIKNVTPDKLFNNPVTLNCLATECLKRDGWGNCLDVSEVTMIGDSHLAYKL